MSERRRHVREFRCQACDAILWRGKWRGRHRDWCVVLKRPEDR